MNEIIQKYFSDPVSASVYADKTVFNPPTDIETITHVEIELDIKFPQDHKDFLLIADGCEGEVGQSYVRLIKVDKIAEYTDMYGGEFFPWIIYLGTDGGNEMFVLDTRDSQLQFGILPFIGDEQDFITLGKTFQEFWRHLYLNDFWDN